MKAISSPCGQLPVQMSLDNFGVRATDPPHSQKSPYNFIVGTPQTQPTVDESSSTVVYIFSEKNLSISESTCFKHMFSKCQLYFSEPFTSSICTLKHFDAEVFLSI